MPLIEYINKFYRGNQASFARLTGVQPAQVTQWINKGFIVVNHTCIVHAESWEFNSWSIYNAVGA